MAIVEIGKWARKQGGFQLGSRLSASMLGWTLLAAGCGSEAKQEETKGLAACAADIDCQDGVYCNGEERCAPAHQQANERGCIAALTPPCAEEFCRESAGSCEQTCNDDADGDGHISLACGGDDCDDEDENRFPGNPEVCDSEGHDEDCSPQTLGDDADEDGFVGLACCNLSAAGELVCGTDCDDTRSGVNPGTVESCNGIDDDCDGLIDNGVTSVFFLDEDGDDYGQSDIAISACSVPTGYAYLPGDCNDADPAVSPGAAEVCDGIDSNCSEGGGVDLSEDADGDGFAPISATHCIPQNAKRDCRDDIADVFPGQTSFFGSPYCEVGQKACSCRHAEFCDFTGQTEYDRRFFCVEESAGCPATKACTGSEVSLSPPSWDYDCDGYSQMAEGAGTCSGAQASSCSDESGFLIGDPRCNNWGCGDQADFVDCQNNMGTCVGYLQFDLTIRCN